MAWQLQRLSPNRRLHADKTPTPATASSITSPSPTVSPNSGNPQGLSYSDKSNTSPGTNAIMDGKAKPTTASTDDDKNLHMTKKKMKKAKLAQHTTPMKSEPAVKSDAMKSDASVSSSSTTSSNPPTSTTSSAAANSLTGRSAGQ